MIAKEIQRRDLFEQLGRVKRRSQWIRAAEVLGFRITHGGKHPYIVRDPQNLNDGDYMSSVTTIPSNLHTTINRKIFKQILHSVISKRMGITENSIWEALDF